MEERDETRRKERLSGEVVETYRRPLPREVVESYARPLPWLEQPVPQAPSASPAPQVRKRRKKKGLWIFLACFCGVLLIAAGVRWLAERGHVPPRNPFAWHDEGREAESISAEITIPTWPVGQGAVLPVVREHGELLTAQEIYRQVNPAVVTVLAQLEQGASVGTGVIFSQDGYLITNYHVVEGGTACTVMLDSGYSYGAKYVAGDAESDLAVLKMEETGFPFAVFGDSDLLTVGDAVYAIGNPLGVELRGTLTDGIVSAIDRDVEVDGRIMTLIQTNAALNTGNSGGPLINQYGQVVGINVVKMTSQYSNVEGLGFAIPSASMDRIVNDLLTYGEAKPEPLLGVSVYLEGVEVEEGLAGLEVIEIVPGGAADLAGIRVGDFLLSADGEPLAASQDLLRIRRRLYVGDDLTMVLWRNGELIEVVLRLEQTVEEA